MIPEIDVQELAKRLEAGAALIDVRETAEYVEAHVPGAQLVPLSELDQRHDELPDGPLLLICRSGARSMRAAQSLAEVGREVTNVSGGTLAWIEAGHPVASGSERG